MQCSVLSEYVAHGFSESYSRSRLDGMRYVVLLLYTYSDLNVANLETSYHISTYVLEVSQ